MLAIGPGWLAETAGALAAHYGCAGQFLVPRMGPGGVGSTNSNAPAENDIDSSDPSSQLPPTPQWRDLDEAAPGAEKLGLGPECESDPAEVQHAHSAAHARVLEAIEQAAGDAGDSRENQSGQGGSVSPGQALDELLRSLGRGGPSGRLDGLLAESGESSKHSDTAAEKVIASGGDLSSGRENERVQSPPVGNVQKAELPGKQFPEVPISPTTNGASRQGSANGLRPGRVRSSRRVQPGQGGVLASSLISRDAADALRQIEDALGGELSSIGDS